MSKLKLSLHPSMTPTLVLVDAIARSGKAIFSDLMPALSKMEHIQFCYEFEIILQGMLLDGVTDEFANAFLRIYFNELSYNLQIGRNVNCRALDQTGVQNFRDPELYFKRMLLQDGDEIVKKCMESDILIPINTHEILANYSQLSKLKLNYKMISLWRNPIDLIYSWVDRGWGERYSLNDPRAFAINLSLGDQIVPWHFAITQPDSSVLPNQFSGANLCASVVFSLIDSSVSNFKKVPKPFIIATKFEDICTDPEFEIQKYADFLGCEVTDYMPTAMQKARVPRLLQKGDRERKYSLLESQLVPELSSKLLKYAENYEKDLYGLQEASCN